ncbi:MAG: hypothetical protein PHF00_11795, partial [Elusimicrobia bacterium]|nr:hypothetical protein [Elusimicrobiota bacterium]
PARPGSPAAAGPAAPAAAAPAAGVAAAPAAAPAEVSESPRLAPAVTPAEAAAEPVGRPESLLGRVARFAAGKFGFGPAFDNSRAAAPGAVAGILPRPGRLPEGLVLDAPPSAPDPRRVSGVSIESYEFPGSLSTGENIFNDGPVALAADPASEADVERALRAMVDADPVRFGVTSADLAAVHVRKVAGVGRQADTFYALFRQRLGGLEIHGSHLGFTIKVIRGRPVVMASMAKLYPRLDVKTVQRFPDERLKELVMERLGPYAERYDLEATFMERKIVHVADAWRAANLYLIEGGPMPVCVGIDIATGEAFAWDPRAGSANGEAKGRVLGHTTEKGPTLPGAALADRPLPDLAVTIDGGKTAFTDEAGRFVAPENLAELAARFQAVLSGKWAKVSNMAGGNLAVSGTLASGQEVTATFNPDGMSEAAIAQVNGYLLTTLVHDWAKSRGLDDKRLDRAIAVRVNIDDECNAYYTPGRPSLNFYKSSENCVNSAYDTVVMHEYGHFIDDMLGGIVNGGVSEGWGDIFSMYILNNPVIGEHFIKKPGEDGRDYIRTGENTYQYAAEDEVHDQGQAWGGFAWKLRKSLMAELGEAAGAALAESLVIPTMLAKAANIPAAMAQVLLADMDQNGALPHEAHIRAAAKAHGVILPKAPGLIAIAARRLTNWALRRSAAFKATVFEPKGEGGSGVGRIVDALSAPAVIGNAGGAVLVEAPAEPPRVLRAKMTFSAGALTRGRIRRELEKFLDQREGITYQLKEYKGWFSSDFLLLVEGPEPMVRRVADAIERWFRSLEQA